MKNNTNTNGMVNTNIKGETTMNNNNNTKVNNENMKGGVNMNNTLVNGGLNMEELVMMVEMIAEGRKHISKVERDEMVIPTILKELKDSNSKETVGLIKKAVASYNKGEKVMDTKESIKEEIMENVYEEINYDVYGTMSKKVRTLVESAQDKEIRKIATNAIKVANILATKDADKLTMKEFNFLMANLSDPKIKAEVIANFMKVSKMKSYVKQLALDTYAKEMNVVLKNRIEIDTHTNKFGSDEYTKRVMLEPSQESELLRACDTFEGTMADEAMTLDGTCVNDICSISMGTSLRNNKSALIGLFLRLIGKHQDNERVFILFKKSGLSKVFFVPRKEVEIQVSEGEYVLEYQLLGITPSGLRTGSITLASVGKYVYGTNKWENIDKRVKLLDDASNNAFSMNFVTKTNEDGTVEFAKYSTLVKLFKAVTRVMMVATPSKKIGEVKNYFVLDNIAAGAGFDKNNYFRPVFLKNAISCEKDLNKPEVKAEIEELKAKGIDFIPCFNTKDGTCLVAMEMILEFLESMGVPSSSRDLLGLCFQARGGGNKNSSQVMNRKNIAVFLLALIERGATISRIVIDGKDVDPSTLTKEQLMELASNLDGVFDENCMKLVKHDEVFDLVCLKKAHQSDTGLNMVINFMMLLQNESKAIELLESRTRKSIMDKFEQLGVYIKLSEDGSSIESVDIDPEKFVRYNNDSQTANWLFKLQPKEILAYFPGIVKSILGNIVTSTGNMLNILKTNVPADYSVIQADMAPIFGLRLLDDGECYCPKFVQEEVEKVSAARHPISGHKAVTTFKVVEESELLERIQRMDTTPLVKKFLTEYILTMDGFVLIPADHYLMEKHDGADFDIDSMQFFKDELVVSIMEEINDFGTIVDRTKDENDSLEGDISHNESQNSIIISRFLTGELEKISRATIRKNTKTPGKKAAFAFGSKINVGKTDMYSEAQSRKSQTIKNADGTYTMDFENTAKLILDYFLNPVAPVGFISTGFYNNALLLLALKSDFTPQSVKEKIAFVIRNRFKVEGLNNYISPVYTDSSFKTYKLRNGKTRTQVTLCKRMCEEVMFRYQESHGTIEETIMFLEDACICNRYPGETSIDAAKNMYQVVDMFNMKDIIKANGSDKNMVTKQEDDEDLANTLFSENVTMLNDMIEGEYTQDNFFSLKLLKNDINKGEKEKFYITEDMTDNELKQNLSNDMVPVIEDSLGRIRKELVEYANLAIVLVAKELEILIKSDESHKLRAQLKLKHDDVLTDSNKTNGGKSTKFKTISVIRSVMGMYIGITESLSEIESVNVLSKDKETEITSKKYLKTAAMQICRNYADLSFMSSETPLTEEEIGLTVAYYGVTKFEEDEKKCSTVNTNIVKMFEKELISFLKSEGLNIVAAEKILYAFNNEGKIVKLDNIAGQNVCANKGHGVTDENINVVFENKKAAFTNGEIIKDENGHFFASIERKCIESDYSRGVYVPVAINSLNPYVTNYKFNEYKFYKETEADIQTGKVEYNVVKGITDIGEEIDVCKLWVNVFVAGVLDNIDFSKSKITFFASEKSIVMYIKNANIFEVAAEQAETIKTTNNAINKVLFNNVKMPITKEAAESTTTPIVNTLFEGIKMPTDSIKEVAISKDPVIGNEEPQINSVLFPDVKMPK